MSTRKEELKKLLERLNSGEATEKENDILYPTAKQVLSEDRWEEIRKTTDEIGYCSFTPVEEYKGSI